MTSKPEGPGPNPGTGKDAGRPAEGGAPKRPHATLDLKATEIKSSEPSTKPNETTAQKTGGKADDKPDMKGASSAAGGSVPASSAKASASAAGDARPASSAATPPAASTEATSGSNKGDATEKPPAPSPRVSVTPKSPPERSVGGVISYLMTGLVGGALALLGAQWLQANGLLPVAADVSEQARALESRIGALEKSRSPAPSDPTLAGRLDEATARLAKLEEMRAALDGLAAAQSRLAEETKGLTEKASQATASGTALERVQKLESQLATLAQAAGSEGDKGRIPQLAALTGRLADLESRIDSQIAAVRKTVPEEVSSRLGGVTEASEAARAGAQRAERDLQGVKSEVAKLSQRAEALKADSERLTQSVEVVKEEQGRQTSALDGLRASLETQAKSIVRAADIAAALSPVAGKLDTLENNLESVVRSEQERKADAERIVVSLELANLKRALDSGQSYARELAAVRKASGGKLDLTVLDRFQSGGLPTLSELEREFRPLAFVIVDADTRSEDAGVIDRLVAGARSVVRVRKVSHDADDKGAEAVVARMETALKDGRLADALEQAKSIPPKAAGRASDWLAKAEARNAVDRAIAAVEAQIKDSLAGGATVPAAGVGAQPGMPNSTPPSALPEPPPGSGSKTGANPSPAKPLPAASGSN
ncbi:MAG: hypothetical protein ACT4N2_11625 [Hyphomicrobium sp.]